jgi:isocitrate dehydrogenase (NAD+)
MKKPGNRRGIPATLIPGDGIGTEIVDAVVAIVDAAGAPFAWERHEGICLSG